jgi:hypothetical protein
MYSDKKQKKVAFTRTGFNFNLANSINSKEQTTLLFKNNNLQKIEVKMKTPLDRLMVNLNRRNNLQTPISTSTLFPSHSSNWI